MPIELDHIFILVPCQAPGAGRLTEIGLNEGDPNSHPGQGTACRRFFFRNAYLELLWLSDVDEVQSGLVPRMRLLERWTSKHGSACPFGLVFRPAARPDCPPPFDVWEYRPGYLAAPQIIEVGTNSEAIAEPLLFHLPFAVRPDLNSALAPQPREHSAGLENISRVELVSPHSHGPSREFRALVEAGLVQLRVGSEHVVEISFDQERRGKRADLRPALPLVLSW